MPRCLSTAAPLSPLPWLTAARAISIGVKDIGRLFTPTYLVVVNPPGQFRSDRFRYVRESQLYDELDFQRATQAFLWALPAVGFKTLYDAQAKTFGARNGDVVLYQTLKDKAGMLTPNITTLYVFSFWDLGKQGPLVVEVPAVLTAGGVMDIWQQPITDMGQTGPDKGAGGKYLILPPGSPEFAAPGYRIVRSPSNQIWFGTRALDPDKAAAEATVRQHRLYGWNQRANPPVNAYKAN